MKVNGNLLPRLSYFCVQKLRNKPHSGPQVGFEEIGTDLREARFRTARRSSEERQTYFRIADDPLRTRLTISPAPDPPFTLLSVILPATSPRCL